MKELCIVCYAELERFASALIVRNELFNTSYKLNDGFWKILELIADNMRTEPSREFATLKCSYSQSYD